MQRGFTLIELLIVIAILSIVGAFSIPYVQGFQASSDAFTIASSVTKTLRKAQQQAIDGKNAGDWGVYFDDSAKTFTLFLGNNYSTRDTSYDLYQNYPDGMNIATDFSDEVYFTKFSGSPSVTGTITLTTQGDTTHAVEINSSGVIEIQ